MQEIYTLESYALQPGQGGQFTFSYQKENQEDLYVHSKEQVLEDRRWLKILVTLEPEKQGNDSFGVCSDGADLCSDDQRRNHSSKVGLAAHFLPV